MHGCCLSCVGFKFLLVNSKRILRTTFSFFVSWRWLVFSESRNVFNYHRVWGFFWSIENRFCFIIIIIIIIFNTEHSSLSTTLRILRDMGITVPSYGP